MRLGCPRCGIDLEYSTLPPRFCSNCGQALSGSAPPPPAAGDAPTQTAPGSNDQPTVLFQAGPPGATLRMDRPGPLSEPMPEAIGGYRLLRLLGGGGMGTVYEAREIRTDRPAAIKLIRPEYADSEETVERFRREGRLASTLLHPRCVFVLAAEEEDGRPYIVMDLMPGSNLHDLVERDGPLPVREAVAKILDVIEGLEEAHRLGIIHRDVKPSNCFLDGDGRVKVGDFGLARTLVASEQLTRTGGFLGTILYAAPEQIRNDHVTPQADVYSVCATLYFLLTGRAPFQEADPAAALARAMSEPAPSLRTFRPEAPRTLEEIVLHGLERSRKHRWQNLAELRLALLPFLDGPEIVATPGWRVTAYLGDMLVLLPLELVLLWLLQRLGVGVERGLGYLFASIGCGLATGLLYFAIPEALFGCTPGKFLARLRVREVATADRPSPWRSMLRTTWFYLIKDSPAVPLWLVIQPLGGYLLLDPDASISTRVLLGVILTGVLPFVSSAIGGLILASTIRRGNGYRGLHELLSGTRVIRLPSGRPRFAVPAAPPWLTLTPPPDQPPLRIGAFVVRGLVRQGADERVLRAEDSALGRPVWLWLRRGEAAALPAVRHTTARATRLRWLASGIHDGWQWDAFVAGPGCLLGDLATRKRPLGWADTLMLLGQLADELDASQQDGTLPPTLSPEQLWLQPGGRLLLLDCAPAVPGPVECPLDLIRQAAAVALEGAARPAGPIRAPVPAQASELLARLMDGRLATLAEVRAALHEAHEHSDEIHRPTRGLQVALSSVSLAPGLLCLFGLAPLLLLLAYVICVGDGINQRLRETRLEALRSAPTTSPENRRAAEKKLVRVRQGLAQLQRDREAVLASWGWFVQRRLHPLEEHFNAEADGWVLERHGSGERAAPDPSMAEANDLPFGPALLALEIQQTLPLLWTLAAWPIVWAVWAGLTRGGLSLRLAGITLVDRDGRPAARWRCCLRCLLTWLPVMLLLYISMWLDLDRVARARYGWTNEQIQLSGWLSWHAWWLALLALPFYVLTAVLLPNRQPHDRLAGVYPVPR